MENWLCKFKKATEALDKLIYDGLYDVSPLLATTMNGKPVIPSEYEKRLAGALVLVWITLISDLFTRGYQFYADIESLMILRAPKLNVLQSPSKSLSKKHCFDVPGFVQQSRAKLR
jgi:hypothetical protein